MPTDTATPAATSTATVTVTPTATRTATATATATRTVVASPTATRTAFNDRFADAWMLAAPGSAAGSTSGASTESGEPKPCGRIGRTVWYRVVPDGSGTLTASTAGSGFDTVLALYRGTSLGNLSALACNDDNGGTNQSRVSAGVAAGEVYYIQLGGYRNATGAYTLTLTGPSAASASANTQTGNVEEPPSDSTKERDATRE